jgi:hypothetical protein
LLIFFTVGFTRAAAQVFDFELTAADHFDGATLTLRRTGAASPQDVFSATGTLSALTQGGNLVVGGITVGTVTTNSSGSLVLTFNNFCAAVSDIAVAYPHCWRRCRIGGDDRGHRRRQRSGRGAGAAAAERAASTNALRNSFNVTLRCTKRVV